MEATWARGGAVVATVAAAFSFVGCRQVVGVEHRSEGPALLELGEDCGACVERECTDTERSCAAHASCAAAAECMVAAGRDNPSGRAECASNHAEGVATAAFASLDACLRAPCQDVCYGRQGFFGAFPSDCAACNAERCLDEMHACVVDSGCETVVVEALAEPEALDPARVWPMFQALREEAAINELKACTTGQCRVECGFDGENLSCVSGYRWALPAGSEARVEMFARYFTTPEESVYLPGVVVELCGIFGAGCDVATGATTDGNGVASLLVPLTSSSGFRGFFRMTAGSSGADFYPAHVYPGHPVAQDTGGGQYLYERALVELLANIHAGGLDSDRGQLIVAFLDCANAWAPNIELRLPPAAMSNAELWYFDGPQGVTGPSGSVVAFNVEPGCYDVVGVHDGAETHRARVSVEAGVITSVFARPLTEPLDVVHTCVPDFEL